MIRWINDMLATSPFDESGGHPPEHLVDVRDLVDSNGNSPALIRQKIHQVSELIAQGKKVLISCDMGMSRSNAVAAGVLAKMENIPFEQAVKAVMTATGENQIKLEMLKDVRLALGEASPRQTKGASALVVGGPQVCWESTSVPETGPAVTQASLDELNLEKEAVSLSLRLESSGADNVVYLGHLGIPSGNVQMGLALTSLRNTLDVCRLQNARLLYISGLQVFGGHAGTVCLAKPETPAMPQGFFGQLHHLSEELIRCFCREHNIHYCIIRTGVVYAAEIRLPRFIRTFAQKALRGQTITTHRYKNGPAMLDLLHWDDLKRAVSLALEKRFHGELNIGAGFLIATEEIARLLVKSCASASTIIHHEIQANPCFLLADLNQAYQELGWAPEASLAEELPLYLESP